MNNINNDFIKFAKDKMNTSSMGIHQFINHQNKVVVPNMVTTASGGNYINPSIIEERNLNVAVMDVFSRLMMDRIIFLGDGVDSYTANVIQAQLLYLNACDPNQDISIYINSPGGEVYSGLGIYDTMQYIDADVCTICTGLAASMASVILAAGQESKRFALPHSRVMLHQPSSGVSGMSSDIDIVAKEVAILKKELYEILSKHTGQPYEWLEKVADRDYWMTAPEALEHGIIDKVMLKK